MNDSSLQKVLAFNGELAALAATGLPLELGMGESEASLSDRLEQITLVLKTHLGRGQSVEQAIAGAPELSPQYRAALQTWLRCDDPTVALDQVSTPALARRQLGMSLSLSMVYPLIVLTLSYLAFLYLCSVTAPKIESIYAQLAQTPSDSLSFLTASRNLMPVWGPLFPLLLVLAMIVWRSRAKRASWAWMPGSSKYVEAMRNADLAQQLARLTESGLSMQESLALVGPILSDDSVTPSPGSQLHSLPSLLRWAVHADLGGQSEPRTLRFVAQTYRQNAKRQSTIWRIVTPTICGVLLAGTFVFGYGLSLFLPVVQLLKDVSMPGGT